LWRTLLAEIGLRWGNASYALKVRIGLMLGNVMQPVKKAAVYVTSVKIKTTLVSMAKESKELQYTVKKG
jgi:hypothetical protein